MPERPARGGFVYARGELRFEAIYYALLFLLGLALLVRRLDLDAGALPAAATGAVIAGAAAFILSVRPRVPAESPQALPASTDVRRDSARSDHSVRAMPLALLLALLVLGASRVPATMALGALAGWAAAALAGLALVRRWERRHGRRAVHGGGRTYAG